MSPLPQISFTFFGSCRGVVARLYVSLHHLSFFPFLLPLSSFYFDIYPYLFISYLGVPGLSCGILDILVVACELWHAGSSSLSRDSTQAPCTGRVES